MSDKSVTSAQIEQIRKMAREKGIHRHTFQARLLDNGTMSRVLDGIKGNLQITVGSPLALLMANRLHTVKVKACLDQGWQEAVDAVGPNTPNSFPVRMVSHFYPPTGKGTVEEELLLLNYPNGDGDWYKALAWGESCGLKKTDPRHVFAITERYSGFNFEVKINPTYVVATEESSFYGEREACSVWWDDSKHNASLYPVSTYIGARVWFAFRR